MNGPANLLLRRPRSWAAGIVLLLPLLAASSVGAAAPDTLAARDSVASKANVAPLVFEGLTLTTFRAPFAGLSPAARAAAAVKRLEELRPPILGDSVRVEPTAEGRVLFVGSTPAFGLTEGDLEQGSGQTLDGEAEGARQRLTRALASRATKFKPWYWLRATLTALFATAILLLFAWGLGWVRRAIKRRLEPGGSKGRVFAIKGIDLSGHVTAALGWLVRIVLVVAAVVVADLFLGFVLGLFPATQPAGRAVHEFLSGVARASAAGLWSALPGLVTVALILLATNFFTGFLGDFFEGVEAGNAPVLGVHPETARATSRLVTALVWILAVVMAYPFIPGGQSDVFKGVSVLLGLLLTLGSAGVVGHMMSGLVLVYSRALRQGDFVRIGEVEGTVLEVGALATKVVNPKNEEFTIPNMVMVGSTIKNYTRLTRQTGAPLTTSVTIGYDAPWRVVHEMLLAAAGRTAGLRKEPAPVVLQASLSDFFVEYHLITRLEEPLQRLIVMSQLHQNIQDAFNERGIQIMSPHFEGQPERPVLVPRAKWNVAPGDAERDAGRERST